MGTFPQYGYPHTRARYAEVADYIGIKGKDDAEKVENLIKAIEVLKKKIGIKGSIKEYGIDEKDFLDRLDEMVGAGVRRPVHGREPPLPADDRNQRNVPESLLRRIRTDIKEDNDETRQRDRKKSRENRLSRRRSRHQAV